MNTCFNKVSEREWSFFDLVKELNCEKALQPQLGTWIHFAEVSLFLSGFYFDLCNRLLTLGPRVHLDLIGKKGLFL